MSWRSKCPASGEDLPVWIGRLSREDKLPDDIFSGPGWPDMEPAGKCRDLGSVAVITPWAKSHKRALGRCKKLVQQAWDFSPGPFSSMEHVTPLDEEMRGPGWGRNQAIDSTPEADWYLYVDSDDMVKPFAFEALNQTDVVADVYWGVTESRRMVDGEAVMSVRPRSLEHLNFHDVVSFGFDRGVGYGVGHYVRGDLQRKLRWFEDHLYEDIEMFIALMAHGTFTRLPHPLVTIDKLTPSTLSEDKKSRQYRSKWSRIQGFWRHHGRKPLAPDLRAFRNEKRKLHEFYGE